MYPPRQEPDSVRQARNLKQGDWVFAFVALAIGVGNLAARHYVLGIGGIWGFGVFVLREVMSKNDVPKNRRRLYLLSGTAVVLVGSLALEWWYR